MGAKHAWPLVEDLCENTLSHLRGEKEKKIPLEICLTSVLSLIGRIGEHQQEGIERHARKAVERIVVQDKKGLRPCSFDKKMELITTASMSVRGAMGHGAEYKLRHQALRLFLEALLDEIRQKETV